MFNAYLSSTHNSPNTNNIASMIPSDYILVIIAVIFDMHIPFIPSVNTVMGLLFGYAWIIRRAGDSLDSFVIACVY